MNLTQEEMRMKKEKHTHHMLNGEEYTGELNEWGYPVGLVFNGCRTEKRVVREEIYQEEDEEDKKPLFEKVLHITHINYWKRDRNSPRPQRKIDSKTGKVVTVASLKDECRALGLKVGGKKAELEARLANFYESNPTGEEE